MEKTPNLENEQNIKDGNQLFYDLYINLEGKAPELGEPEVKAFRKNGSLHKACIGVFKHISSLKNKAEKNFWLEKIHNTKYICELLFESFEELDNNLDELTKNQENFDFIKEWCKLYEHTIDNYIVELITFLESSETPLRSDKKKWN